MILLWDQRFVEHVVTPPEPRHIVAQQILALCLQGRARLRIHRGLPQLIRVHLAEALEPLDAEALRVHLADDPLALRFGLRVASDLARADPVQRRLRDVQVAVLDNVRHVPVEER